MNDLAGKRNERVAPVSFSRRMLLSLLVEGMGSIFQARFETIILLTSLLDSPVHHFEYPSV
jgi:hypothetical protein